MMRPRLQLIQWYQQIAIRVSPLLSTRDQRRQAMQYQGLINQKVRRQTQNSKRGVPLLNRTARGPSFPVLFGKHQLRRADQLQLNQM